ncbi:MAG: zinc ribbon domain-containing protein [Armatimonadota bacterium]
MVQDNLVQFLPSDLNSALQQTISPGEATLISLPGAMGEALAVTNSRIAVVKDKGPTEGIEVFSYPLVKVTDVELGTSATGGMLIIKSPGKAADEKRTVYFSSYDRAKFESATEKIKELVSVAETAANGGRISTAAAPVAVNSTASASSSGIQKLVCSSCGCELDAHNAFCPSCGANVQDICQVCSGAIPAGANYCPSCGSEAKTVALTCPACGKRVNSSVMSYCPHCGTSLSPKCASCGAAIIIGWPRCRYCGREIGSENMYRGMYAQRQRELEEQANAPSPVDKTSEEAYVEEKQSPADFHNAKGAELFEDDKINEAIDEFRSAVALEPNNYSYHCNLAAAYDEAGQSDDARREYERTLELNPNETTALLYLGYLLNEQEDSERAASLWKRVIEVAPGTPEAEEAQQNLSAQGSL